MFRDVTRLGLGGRLKPPPPTTSQPQTETGISLVYTAVILSKYIIDSVVMSLALVFGGVFGKDCTFKAKARIKDSSLKAKDRTKD